MRRRAFITLLGGAATWPVSARAALASEASSQRGDSKLRALASEASGHRGDSKVQPAPVPIIGDLSSGTPAGFAPMVAAFHRGLNEAGHIQGRNFTIEFRRSEGQDERLPAFAADLVHRQVAVIAATGGSARERFTSSPIRSSPVGSDDWSR